MNQITDNSDARSRQFFEALDEGRICLHPNDTIPGLCFLPSKESSAYHKLLDIKGYSERRPFVSVVSSLAVAETFWQPLPVGWSQALELIWPAPLTVSWKASDRAPKELQSTCGRIALRVPVLSDEDKWFSEVLARVQMPIPSTSVNRKGEAPASNWLQALSSVANMVDGNIFVPEQSPSAAACLHAVNSTLIVIEGCGSYKIVREGAFSNFAYLDECLARYS